MICKGCAKTADLNRRLKQQGNAAWYNHPHNCGCACQHRTPQEWHKFFSVKEPDAEDS